MKTEVTFIYRGRKMRTVVNALNPSNAGAIVLRSNNLNPDQFKIINCIGGTIKRDDQSYHIPKFN